LTAPITRPSEKSGRPSHRPLPPPSEEKDITAAREALAALAQDAIEPEQWLKDWRQTFDGRPADPEKVSTLSWLRFLAAPLRHAIIDAWAYMARPRQPSTILQYEVVGRRLATQGSLPGDIATPSRRSHGLYRAALRHTAALQLVKRSVTVDQMLAKSAVAPAVGDEEAAELERKWQDHLQHLHQFAALARICIRQSWSTVQQARERGDATAMGECPLVASRHRRSTAKRPGLGRLPKGWQDRLLAKLPLGTHPYALPVRATALFGVRPAELCREGVVIELTAAGWLTCLIPCAKVRAGEAPRWRRVTIAVEPGRRVAEEVRDLLATYPGGRLVVRIADPRRFCDAVRAASRRAFPRRADVVTPYSLRHQFAADAKAGQVRVVEGEDEGGDGGASGGVEQDNAADQHDQVADGEVLLAQAGGLMERATSEGGYAPSPRYGQRTAGHRAAVAAALGHVAPRSQSHYGTRRQSRGALRWHAKMNCDPILDLPVSESVLFVPRAGLEPKARPPAKTGGRP
jgi:hypothetical protein